MEEIHLGTSGWSYKDWVGPFYTRGVAPANYLSHYAQHFDSVEIDSTFYRIPAERIVRSWEAKTPENFLFCPKFPRVITHDKRLQNCSEELVQFLSRMDLLGDKLGPLVLQFDYGFTPDFFPVLKAFLSEFPAGYRIAVEIRNRKWLHFEPFFSLLEERRCALVIQDLYYMPRFIRLTAPFTYIRLLGDRRQIPDDFSHARVDRELELSDWAQRIVDMASEGVEVFAYSNNRYQGHAPETVRTLRSKVNAIVNRGKLFF